MNTTSINAKSFYKEISTSGNFWTIKKDNGVPTFKSKEGVNTFFVWSSRDRVSKIINNENLFQDCSPLEIPWYVFASGWLPDMVDQQIVFSLNWTGNDNPVWEESAEEFGINMENQLKRLK